MNNIATLHFPVRSNPIPDQAAIHPGYRYDMTLPDSAALFGFFGLSAFTREHYRDNLEALIMQQMERLFGVAMKNPLHVLIQDWSLEPFTATEQDRTLPTEHPRYGHPWLLLDHWQDKFYFCGTETAEAAGGYLEGALEASDRVFTALTL
jgi:monoamine oxidase